MKMLTKFESKSSRAKGIAFHPTRPWALVSLASLTIQLWDYRMGTLIDRFQGHTGPVRCVAFHPTQPLFVSGGDDYVIRVWSLTTRTCIFQLTGHLDYIRTVYFHHDSPWILLCSDDQTIRIWNWQNRLEIACLTGHNHYVMSAMFHPCEDLIVLASLDQTVRVWDVSGLRKKYITPSSKMRSYEEQLLPQQDIFGNVNAVVKFVLEGHDKGVNWAAFHPTLPYIASAGDDRVVKLWRMTENKAWEIDTCRGHTGNVLSVVFHPRQPVIISVGDDKSIRVWDLNKRTPLKQFRRENDRIYLVACHPTMSLFGSCHDSGAMVFKLERERPAHTLVGPGKMYYVNNESELRLYDFERGELKTILTLARLDKPWTFMRTLSHNPTDNSVLVTFGDSRQLEYRLVALPKSCFGAIEPSGVHSGGGDFAAFISRNRFVLYTNGADAMYVKDLLNQVTKSVPLDLVLHIVPSTAGRVLLIKANSVVNFDVQQRKELAELGVSKVKYAVWSHDGSHVALLAKHSITIATKDLVLVATLHETIRIKSAAWDETGVLLYTTLNHIKYTLLNGDNGLIKTVKNTVYLVKVVASRVFVLTREGTVEQMTIDPTEYRFKRALGNGNFGEVLRIIRSSNLVGQNIIAYLQKKGFPEIALQFVQDPETRFELAMECSNLPVAIEQAKALDDKSVWERLAQEALLQGNLDVVENAYQQLHAFDKLSFVYFVRGDQQRLAKMTEIAERRGDASALVQNTLYDNNVEKRCLVFRENGMLPLAYTLAKANGLTELADSILQEAGKTELDVQMPDMGSQFAVPRPIAEPVSNWPLRDAQLLYFENAMINGAAEAGHDPSAGPTNGPSLLDFGDDDPAERDGGGAMASERDDYDNDNDLEDEAEGGAWDLDEDLELEAEAEAADDGASSPAVAAAAAAGDGEVGTWLRNAKLPASFIACGAFELAASLLNKQVGVVAFEPLRARFMEVYAANKLYLPGVPALLAMPAHVRANHFEENPTVAMPYVPGYGQLDDKLALGFKHFKANNLTAAIAVFRDIIYTVLVLVVRTPDNELRCKEVLSLCREYILGLSIELVRRALPAEDVQRNLELAAYFTRARLQKPHRLNALQVAMSQSFKHKNYLSASHFAEELLKLVQTGPRAEQAQKLKAKADSLAVDSIEIDFDPFAEFEICAASYTPIYAGTPLVTEKLVGASYKPEYKGEVCRITEVTAIGVTALGLRIRA